MPYTPKRQNNNGFTLMEMLIVVAIIAILIVIAIPVFNSQLERARDVTDAANMRSAKALGATYYLSDNDASGADISYNAQGAAVYNFDATSGVLLQGDVSPYGKSLVGEDRTNSYIEVTINSDGVIEALWVSEASDTGTPSESTVDTTTGGSTGETTEVPATTASDVLSALGGTTGVTVSSDHLYSNGKPVDKKENSVWSSYTVDGQQVLFSVDNGGGTTRKSTYLYYSGQYYQHVYYEKKDFGRISEKTNDNGRQFVDSLDDLLDEWPDMARTNSSYWVNVDAQNYPKVIQSNG